MSKLSFIWLEEEKIHLLYIYDLLSVSQIINHYSPTSITSPFGCNIGQSKFGVHLFITILNGFH